MLRPGNGPSSVPVTTAHGQPVTGTTDTLAWWLIMCYLIIPVVFWEQSPGGSQQWMPRVLVKFIQEQSEEYEECNPRR